MSDFDLFDTPDRRKHIVTGELIRRGGFHVHSPNNAAMEKEISKDVDAAMAVLREYHKWLTGRP